MPDITADMIKAISELTQRGERPDVFGPGDSGRMYIATPAGRTLADITDKLRADAATPRYRSGTVVLQDMQSFIDFVRRMADRPRTVLFGDKPATLITAIFDHHDPLHVTGEVMHQPEGEGTEATLVAAEMGTDGAQPRWGRYRATYSFPHSTAWKAWKGKHNQAQSQEALSIFLEDNLVYVLPVEEVKHDPQIAQAVAQLGLKLAGPVELLDLSRNFRITVDEVLSQHINLASGETELHFESKQRGEDKSGTRVIVPTAFLVALPVFEGGALYRLLVRLRTRKTGEGMKFIFDIYRLSPTEERAFTDECGDIAAKADVPLFFGVAPDPSAP